MSNSDEYPIIRHGQDHSEDQLTLGTYILAVCLGAAIWLIIGAIAWRFIHG